MTSLMMNMKKDSDALRKELEETAPFLAHLKEKPDGLSVPDGYFEQLPRSVLERIADEDAASVRRISPIWFRAAAAASVILLAGVAVFLFRPAQPEYSPESVALTADEVHQYITLHIDDFDLDLLLQFADNGTGHSGWFEDTGLEDPEMKQYMDELLDDIDLETLEELL